MYCVEICMLCAEQCCEILPDELDDAALFVENLVSQAVLELFGTVLVGRVSISFLSDESLLEFENEYML